MNDSKRVHSFVITADGNSTWQGDQCMKKKLEMIGYELKFLVKGIMRSPKSYTLWF